MKTKYIKVNAADRLPEEEGCFLTDLGEFDFSDNEFKNEIQMPVNGIDWWLEEVPDKEEEIRGMLKKCLEALKTANFQLSKMNAVLLNELKPN